MSSAYFEHVDFYQKLVSRPFGDTIQTSDASTNAEKPNDADVVDTTICARIRPLSEEEKHSQHISGISANGPSLAVLFEPRKKFNGAPDATRHEFALGSVYGADTPTDMIYREAAQDLVPWIFAGGVSTLFAYGQTGSGKTFTVAGITSLIVKDLMAMAELDKREIYVCCFEVLGKKVYDLLADRRAFSIMEDSFGVVQLVGVQEKYPSSEEEFLSIVETSALLRTTASTSKNDQSSRSHAVFRIRTVDRANPEKLDGELFLVDLAGSEGSQDSKNHTAERLAETKEINTSLSILKDCIRGRTLWGLQQLQITSTAKKSIHIPWRSSKLTQILKHVFATQVERACKTKVIACVAPSIVDSSYSKNTLRYAEMLKVPVPRIKSKQNSKNPSSWTNEKTKQWVTENSGTPSINATVLTEDLNGIQLCKLPQKEFIARCLQTPDVGREQAVAFYQKLWRLQVDSRKKSSRSDIDQKEDTVQVEKQETPKAPFQTRIKPGMFARLSPGTRELEEPYSSFNGIDTVMIMSPAGPEDFDQTREDRKFVCALVGPSVMTDAYELYVEKTGVYALRDMENEVLMEYDLATRYYYMDL